MTRWIMMTVMALVLLGAAPRPASAAVNLFACEPEWAALADEIGGDLVKPYAATTAAQDPHYIRARPSLLAKMRRSDVLLCSGAGLEVGWLPVLLQKAGRASVQPGGAYHIMAADHIQILEKPVTVDRSMGDVHPEGNPHLHLNPHNMLPVAAVLTDKLAQLDPSNATTYRQRHAAFVTRWQNAIGKWEAQAESLKGMRVITHHKSFTYLTDWLDIVLAGTIEPKPGIPPTTGHLESLLQLVRADPVVVILRTPYDPADGSNWLAQKSGTPTMILPFTIGGSEQAEDLFGLFDDTLSLLVKTGHAKR